MPRKVKSVEDMEDMFAWQLVLHPVVAWTPGEAPLQNAVNYVPTRTLNLKYCVLFLLTLT